MGRFCVRVWIPVVTDEEEVYSSYEDASQVEQSISLMQPENIYQIIDLDSEEEEEESGDNEVAR